jgi:hypothetical protein
MRSRRKRRIKNNQPHIRIAFVCCFYSSSRNRKLLCCHTSARDLFLPPSPSAGFACALESMRRAMRRAVHSCGRRMTGAGRFAFHLHR